MLVDYLIVGTGFAGSVLAERLSNLPNKKILIIDERSHIGGNSYDFYDDNGILAHKYGPHIFHTNNSKVFNYLSKFTKWRKYEHYVKTFVRGQYLPFPININTLNELYGLRIEDADEFDNYLSSMRQKVSVVKTFEDSILNKFGKEIYDIFFKNYSLKQWGIQPSLLDASIAERISHRPNFDNRYFTDKYQFMPHFGFTNLFERMLGKKNIEIILNTCLEKVINKLDYKTLIYTGPIDRFFNYRYGKLNYRSLNFVFKYFDREFIQDVAVINYPNIFNYTRTTEFKHITGQKHKGTSVVYEYPYTNDNEPYYPILNDESLRLRTKYIQLGKTIKNVYFLGRLGTYQYLNMDQVIENSLNLFEDVFLKFS